jgi:tRNA threonylcarbamoyladenosine biosynthesis protein TsaB
MILLGFDTATPSTAVGLRLADGRTLQARDDPSPGAHPGHAIRLLEMTHELLAAADIRWSEIDRIAVGTGPGTFTGLRVGIATARGLAQSLSIELVGVPSLRALALPALGSASRPEGVLAVIDARRGEAFAAAYGASEGDRAPVELAAARALAPGDLGNVLTEAAEQGFAADRGWIAVGDGAVRFRSELERLALAVPADSSPLHLLSAQAICELALRAHPVTADQEVLPSYGRRPDAEITLEAAAAGGPSLG